MCWRVYTSFEKKERERQERTLAIGWEITGEQDIVRNGESEREKER